MRSRSPCRRHRQQSRRRCERSFFVLVHLLISVRYWRGYKPRQQGVYGCLPLFVEWERIRDGSEILVSVFTSQQNRFPRTFQVNSLLLASPMGLYSEPSNHTSDGWNDSVGYRGSSVRGGWTSHRLLAPNLRRFLPLPR